MVKGPIRLMRTARFFMIDTDIAAGGLFQMTLAVSLHGRLLGKSFSGVRTWEEIEKTPSFVTPAA